MMESSKEIKILDDLNINYDNLVNSTLDVFNDCILSEGENPQRFSFNNNNCSQAHKCKQTKRAQKAKFANKHFRT